MIRHTWGGRATAALAVVLMSAVGGVIGAAEASAVPVTVTVSPVNGARSCLLYTSDAADE